MVDVFNQSVAVFIYNSNDETWDPLDNDKNQAWVKIEVCFVTHIYTYYL